MKISDRLTGELFTDSGQDREIYWRETLLAVCLFGLLSAAMPIRAQELVGGWEGNRERGYVFSILTYGWKMSEQSFFVVRGSGSFLYYRTQEAGQDVEVRSPGTSAGIAYRFRTRRLSVTFGPGYETRRTRRLLPDGTEVRETEKGLIAQGDVFFQATPLINLRQIVSYSDANRYFWTRSAIKRRITGEHLAAAQIGLELTAQGDNQTRTYQAGGVFEVSPRPSGSIQLRAGYSREKLPDGTRHSLPYFGVGFYMAF